MDDSSAAAAASGNVDATTGLVRELPAAVRQLLGTELQRELMRRHHNHNSSSSSSGVAGSSPSAGGSSGGGIGIGTPPKPAAKPAVKPMPKPITVEEAKPVEKRDMFGRVIVNAKRGVKRGLSGLSHEGGGGAGATATAGETPPVVRFKFHEGVTDAVRRPVKVRDLL